MVYLLRKSGELTEKQSDLPDLFRIRPIRSAWREARVGELFQTEKEQQWVVSQLKLLRHWPLTLVMRNEFSIDLDVSSVDCAGETFFEMRLRDQCLSHGGNLRVFFWVHDESKTIWIIHG